MVCHINLISLIINISQITSPASHGEIPRHPDKSSDRVKFNILKNSNNTDDQIDTINPVTTLAMARY